MKSINHMNTEVFTWKPSEWRENHGSFTNSKIYFARFNPGWGNNPLQFTLQENTDSIYTIDFPTPTGRGSNPCKPIM